MLLSRRRFVEGILATSALAVLPAAGHAQARDVDAFLRFTKLAADDMEAAFALESGRVRVRRTVDDGDAADVTDYLRASEGPNIARALERAFAVSNRVRIPKGHWRVELATIPDGGVLLGPGTLIVSGNSATPGLLPGNNASVIGLSFELSSATALGVRLSNGRQGLVVDSCDFTGLGSAVGIRIEANATDCAVRNCIQRGGESLLLAIGSRRTVVDGNLAYGVARSLQFWGGSDGTVSNNTTLAGIAAILFLSNRRYGTVNMCSRNRVEGNWVLAPSEEGISFDCHGNDPVNWPEAATPELHLATRLSKDNVFATRPVLEPAGWADGFAAVSLSGPSLGTVGIIGNAEPGSIAIEGDASAQAFEPGDRLQITTGFFDNQINANFIYRSGTYGVGLWGSAWWNSITNNYALDCYIGVLVASVWTPTAGVRAFSGRNSVRGNFIRNLRLVKRKHWLPAHGLAIYNHNFGAPIPRWKIVSSLSIASSNRVEDPKGANLEGTGIPPAL